MIIKNFSNIKRILISSFLISLQIYAQADRTTEKSVGIPRSDMFSLEEGSSCFLMGKIENKRYYSPKNVFSCEAYHFGTGEYITQDGLTEEFAAVGFYNPVGNYKKAELIFFPGLETRIFEKKELKDIFDRFGIEMLKSVHKAEGIHILQEEMVGNNMFFAAISIDKLPGLETISGNYQSSTRGYLVFQEKDKMVLLSNQHVTFWGDPHCPKNHIENLKKDILAFRETFEFGPTPIEVVKNDSPIEKKQPEPQKKAPQEDYEVYVNQIIKSFANEMEKEFRLVCDGHGGRMPYNVEEIEVSFIANRSATIEEARKLEVTVTERFLEAINSHEKIRPFLKEYPFKANRAEVSISFRKPDNTPYKDGSVAYVFHVKNKIFYRADKEGSPRLTPLMDEPYEEALKIVKASSPISQPDRKNEEEPSNLSDPPFIEMTLEDALKGNLDQLGTKYKFYGGESS